MIPRVVLANIRNRNYSMYGNRSHQTKKIVKLQNPSMRAPLAEYKKTPIKEDSAARKARKPIPRLSTNSS